MIDGIELFQLFQRETPDGDLYLAGWWGSAAVAVVRDDAKPGVWRVIVSDPSRANNRDGASRARAIAAPTDDEDLNVIGEGFDELPADLA